MVRIHGTSFDDGKPWLISCSLKFNFKLGGQNHAIQNGITGLKDNTMIVGADVTHSAKGPVENGAPSLAGVVASSGQSPSNYVASARLQSNNTEVSLPPIMNTHLCES